MDKVVVPVVSLLCWSCRFLRGASFGDFEISQLQLVEKFAFIPVVQTVQDTQTSVSLGSRCSLSSCPSLCNDRRCWFLPEVFRFLDFLGDDFRFVSVFCAELGSTADTCGASVYEAFWKIFSL